MAYPWYEGGEVVRVKVERVGEGSQRQLALEPAEGSPGLFGWNTITSDAKEVSCLTRQCTLTRSLKTFCCLIVGGDYWLRIRCSGSPPSNAGTNCCPAEWNPCPPA